MIPRLGVNIDHIATLREARQTSYPDPLEALPILKQCEAHQVTIHLREDRRHIQDHDVKRIVSLGLLPVNLEMALTPEMVAIAREVKPTICTIVPEKRKEVTTEGGLDCVKSFKNLQKLLPQLHEKKIRVSLFIDPEPNQIDQALALGVSEIELHTGAYCEVFGTSKEDREWLRLKKATEYASQQGIKVYAGHGLNIKNLPRVTQIKEIEEYNIGHSIIARAVFIGLEGAIQEVQAILMG